MTREEACNKLHTLACIELGVHEVAGPESCSRIIEYDTHTTLIAWLGAPLL